MKIDLELEVKKIIAEVAEYEPEEVDLDANIYSQLGVDSIKAIEIAVLIEKKFKVSVREEQLASIVTGRQIKQMLERALKKKKKKKLN